MCARFAASRCSISPVEGPAYADHVSEATTKTLEAARGRLTEARQVAVAEQEKTLEQIAQQLPARAERIVLSHAHAQPQATKALGKHGLDALRAEVAAGAAAIGREFSGALDGVEWPATADRYSKVMPREIHSSLFKRFYRKLNRISDPIRKAGYAAGDARDAEVLPQQLYDESSFADVARALTAVAEAQRAFDKARVADDKSAVDDLWG